MFGEYAQIASYLNSRDTYGKGAYSEDESLPAYLRPQQPTNQYAEYSRGRNTLKEDFIMLAEFSELEGPKPVVRTYISVIKKTT